MTLHSVAATQATTATTPNSSPDRKQAAGRDTKWKLGEPKPTPLRKQTMILPWRRITSYGEAVFRFVGKELRSNRLPLPILHPEFRMSISKCVVRLKDSHDTVHEAVVYAESLYEAVLLGLNRLSNVGWESDTDDRQTSRGRNSPRADPTRRERPEAVELGQARYGSSGAANAERES